MLIDNYYNHNNFIPHSHYQPLSLYQDSFAIKASHEQLALFINVMMALLAQQPQYTPLPSPFGFPPPAISPLADKKIQKRETKDFPAFDSLVADLGFKTGGRVTKKQAELMDSISKKHVPKEMLMWDLELQKTRKINENYLGSHFQSTELTSQDGRKFTAYYHPDFKFLGHFSSLENSAKILNKEIEAKSNPDLKTSKDYFWNSQFRVCCSLLKEGKESFFASALKKEGLGFLIDVPDPHANILHTFPRDAWTPTALLTKEASSVTSNGSIQVSKEYNHLMMRYKALSSYIHGAYLNAKKEVKHSQLLSHVQTLDRLLMAKRMDPSLCQPLKEIVCGSFNFTQLTPKIIEALEPVKAASRGHPDIEALVNKISLLNESFDTAYPDFIRDIIKSCGF